MPKVYNKKNKNVPKEAIYVGRPTDWGNPYFIGRDGDRREVVDKYARWITSNTSLCERARRELKGKDLVCWCAPEACHADVLLEIANG
jgi:hypothetical protein